MAHKLIDPFVLILTTLLALTLLACSVQHLPAAPTEENLIAVHAYSEFMALKR